VADKTANLKDSNLEFTSYLKLVSSSSPSTTCNV